jgi:hypothetical protein
MCIRALGVSSRKYDRLDAVPLWLALYINAALMFAIVLGFFLISIVGITAVQR